MAVEETLEAQHQARMSLVNCAKYHRERDAIIRHAASVGIPKVEIARLLEMSRQRVSAIVGRTGTE